MITLEYLRHFRFFDFAIFDTVLSFLAVFLLSPLLSKLFRKMHVEIPKLNWLFLTLPLAITVHILVGKMTPMTKYFLDIHSHYILKIIILVSLILGLRGIKKIRG